MAQTTPATEVAADAADAAHDLFEEVLADDVIDLEEVRRMRRALDQVVHLTDLANLSRAIGVCVMRGGFGGPRHRRLMREWEEIEELAPGNEPLDAA